QCPPIPTLFAYTTLFRSRLLLVGDADQLPSVGPGNVLRDVIRAAEAWGQDHALSIPVVRLDTIFRQQDGSTIVANAHRVLHGQRSEEHTSELQSREKLVC